MFFKYPSVLFALLALIVPILIHLYNLRKHQTLLFTNVKLLKDINLETKAIKSLKKWLILTCRLLYLSLIILAFAQPYFSKEKINFNESELVIYLDNSLSMQALSKNSSIFNEYITDLIDYFPDNQRLSLFTNDKEFKNVDFKYLKEAIKTIDYTYLQNDFNAIKLKAIDLFSNDNDTDKFLILMSDLQTRNDSFYNVLDNKFNTRFLKKPFSRENISIDSVYISNYQVNSLKINASIKGTSENKNQVIPVTLLDDTGILLKTNVNLNESSIAEFNLPNKEIKNGTVRIYDNSISFDNHYFFNISKPSLVDILIINENSSDKYLNALFNDPVFTKKSVAANNFSPEDIENKDVIILNELNNIPEKLVETLYNFSINDGKIVCIPKVSLNGHSSYNRFLTRFDLSFDEMINKRQELTEINYNSPLFKGVFLNQSSNFNYPYFKNFYPISGLNKASILKFSNNYDLLAFNKNLYLFSSELNLEHTDFSLSELIVPVFYNIAFFSSNFNTLSYVLGEKYKIPFKHDLSDEHVIRIKDSLQEFIPIQKKYNSKSEIELNYYPTYPGHYKVILADKELALLGFNHNRSENNNSFIDPSQIEIINTDSSLDNLINSTKSNSNSIPLWKWFVIFALMLLIIEIFIFKFFK